MTEIILASSSKYRRQLLERINIPFKSHAPEIDETPTPGESPEQLVLRLATSKAQALAATYPHSLIIGSDQVAELDGKIITKPETHTKATQQLRDCSGKIVRFHTGLTLLNSKTGNTQSTDSITEVHFRELNSAEIESYLRREQPYDCAGSFKAEGLGICLFNAINSNDPSSLIGLPLIQLTSMLLNEGISPLS